MQTTSTLFQQRADGQMRPLAWSVLMALDRQLVADPNYFTVGVSSVGGTDIIPPDTGDVMQLWDEYEYSDYTDRLVSMEWTQTLDPQASVQSAIGTLVLDNHDDYFAADNIALPGRPVRLGAGFGNQMTGTSEVLPQLVATTDAPVFDESTKTVAYNLSDFLATLYQQPLPNSVMMINARTDEVLDALLQLMGLSPTQYDLDVGFNIIPFAYFDPTTSFGDACKELMQAEMGRLYMSETGRITFKNRQNYSQLPVWTFDRHNVIDYTTNSQSAIVNVVEITANVREEQQNQPYWQLSSSTEIPAGQSVVIAANFSDPVVTVDAPVEVSGASTSLYTANTASDGSGTDGSAHLTLTTAQFATSYLMTFANSAAFSVYVTTLQLYATPAAIVNTIDIIQSDTASVEEFNQQTLQIQDDLFPDAATATSRAKIILADYASYNQLQTLTVKGNPALQVGDAISVAVRSRTYNAVTGDTLSTVATAYGLSLTTLEALNPGLSPTGGLADGQQVKLAYVPQTCTIVAIDNALTAPQFQQILTVMPFTPVEYFTAGTSRVGGTDIIAP